MSGIVGFFKRLYHGKFWIPKLGIYWECPFGTWWRVRRYFKRPRFRFYCGPFGYRQVGVHEEDSKLTISDNDGNSRPLYRKGDPIMGQFGVIYFVSTEFLKWDKKPWQLKYFPLTVCSNDVEWKERHDDVVFERPGIFSLIWGTDLNKARQFCFVVKPPKSDNIPGGPDFAEDLYWPMVIWTSVNCGGDLRESIRTWPYGDVIVNNSKAGHSWFEGYLTKNGMKIYEEELKKIKCYEND